MHLSDRLAHVLVRDLPVQLADHPRDEDIVVLGSATGGNHQLELREEDAASEWEDVDVVAVVHQHNRVDRARLEAVHPRPHADLSLSVGVAHVPLGCVFTVRVVDFDDGVVIVQEALHHNPVGVGLDRTDADQVADDQSDHLVETDFFLGHCCHLPMCKGDKPQNP